MTQRRNDHEPKLLEPQPLPAPKRLAPALVATGVLAVAIATGFMFLGSDGGAPADIATAQSLQPSEGILVPVSTEDPRAFEDAVKGLQLSDPDRARVRTAAAAGDLDLGLIAVWDYLHQDGDIVAVSSAGFVQYVPIHNQPSIVVLPYEGPGSITVTGLHDGGGGVTVAVASGSGPLQLRPLMVGESLQVSIP